MASNDSTTTTTTTLVGRAVSLAECQCRPLLDGEAHAPHTFEGWRYRRSGFGFGAMTDVTRVCLGSRWRQVRDGWQAHPAGGRLRVERDRGDQTVTLTYQP